MEFADAYLQKAGLRGMLIKTDPPYDLEIIVTIPVYNESGLTRCLDSLFLCGLPERPAETPESGPPEKASESLLSGPPEKASESLLSGQFDISPLPHPPLPFRAEVLILVNAPADAPDEVLEQNRITLKEVRSWIAGHHHPFMEFHVWLDHSFNSREAGVGLARKILMDEAVRRFSAAENPDGIIASLDADVVVDPNYLTELKAHFASTGCDGCSIYFEHPVVHASGSADDHGLYSREVYAAIIQYELHLRYYVNSVRSTGYPYATHTVGSSFAVRAEVYCKEGGMNRRQGGEDFYFIQKVAQRGNFSQCNRTRVVPSPRPSGRVPFGTGPVVRNFLKDQAMLTTYHPAPFRMLEKLFSDLDRLALDTEPGSAIGDQSGVLKDFLLSQRFADAVQEIRENSASAAAFRKRFWRWFNMFRILKFLHYARDNGYPDMEVSDAARQLLIAAGSHFTDKMEIPGDLPGLLDIYRQIDRACL